MIFGLVRGVLKSALFGAVVVTCASGVGYFVFARAKIAAPANAIVTVRLCRTTASLSGGTLPATFEAFVKERDAHNFLGFTNMDGGLVSKRLEWSHGSFDWVEDANFVLTQAPLVRERTRLARRDVGALVKDLRAGDAAAREISAKELRIRTGQTFGYAYDAPEAEREKTALLWERWWADEANRAQYGAKRAIDFADGALDTLRKAIGEPKPPPPPAGPSSPEDRPPAAPPAPKPPPAPKSGGARY